MLLIGFSEAARQLWMMTVSREMMKQVNPAAANIQGLSAMRDGHTAQHLFYTLLALLLGNAEIGQRQFHVLLNIQFVNQLALLQLSDILTIESISSAGGIVEQAQYI